MIWDLIEDVEADDEFFQRETVKCPVCKALILSSGDLCKVPMPPTEDTIRRGVIKKVYTHRTCATVCDENLKPAIIH